MSDSFAITLILIVILLLVRNYVTYRIRTEQIQIISKRAQRIIDSDQYLKWEDPYIEFRTGPSYEAIMFNLTKWTRASVYGPSDIPEPTN